MSIIINCAGSVIVNGIYDYNAATLTFYKRGQANNIYSPVINYVSDRWIIQDIVDQYYYLIEANNENSILDNGFRTWVLSGGGEPPLPKATALNYTTCTTLVVSDSPETNANNGVYNLTYTEDPIPEPFYVNSLNGTYTIEQMSLDEGQREWALLGAGIVPYGSITVPDGNPPIGELAGGGNIDFSNTCSFLNCEETPTSSDFFVYTKNNVHHIRKLSPQLGSEPTECPEGLYPEGWFCCPGGGAALTAGDCGVPGPNYMASPPVTNFFIRKQQ